MASNVRRARAVTMWDFSWLERRWPGAGYEDWDQALTELVDRGYDTVRIDAYPHLVARGATQSWRLQTLWTQQVWGAQSAVTVEVLQNLTNFIRCAADHGVDVALSSWFRQDADDTRMELRTPAALARAWIATLAALDAADVLGSIAYVDLCNEFPLAIWAPFLYGNDEAVALPVADPRVQEWMVESIALVRSAYPDLLYTYSFAGDIQNLEQADVGTFDLLEPHLWMAGASDFYDRVGYAYERVSPVGYDNLVLRGHDLYRADQDRYDAAIFDQIDRAADWSRATGKPLVTTECWSIVDYKDWPGLDWGWVKDLNERALARAAATGRWVGLATSNFAGPQFVGLWRDVDYHRRLTDLIHAAPVDQDLRPLGD